MKKTQSYHMHGFCNYLSDCLCRHFLFIWKLIILIMHCFINNHKICIPSVQGFIISVAEQQQKNHSNQKSIIINNYIYKVDV